MDKEENRKKRNEALPNAEKSAQERSAPILSWSSLGIKQCTSIAKRINTRKSNEPRL